MPAAAVAAVGTVAGIAESRSARRDARKAERRQQNVDNKNLQLAEDEFDYKKELVNDMLGDANLSDADYAQATGDAAGTVRDMYSKAGEIEKRNLSRMGINPASGRFRQLNKQNALDEAAAEADAVNTTRRGLKDYERSATAEARSTGLGLNNNTTHRVLSGMSDRAANDAISSSNAARSSLSSAFSLAGRGLAEYNDWKSPKPDTTPKTQMA